MSKQAYFIKELRHIAGLTQAEFASALRVSVYTVIAWENDNRSSVKHARYIYNLIYELFSDDDICKFLRRQWYSAYFSGDSLEVHQKND